MGACAILLWIAQAPAAHAALLTRASVVRVSLGLAPVAHWALRLNWARALGCPVLALRSSGRPLARNRVDQDNFPFHAAGNFLLAGRDVPVEVVRIEQLERPGDVRAHDLHGVVEIMQQLPAAPGGAAHGD